jgi:hypothetical protein
LIRNKVFSTKFIALATAGAGLFAVSANASAQTGLFSESLVGAGNAAYGTYWVGNGTNTSDPVTTSWGSSFTGLNGAGNTETMSFNGTTTSQSNYGSLHVYTQLSMTNSYYNSSNPLYFNGSSVDAAGSPNDLQALGFAVFTDTLQFGGSLESGYQAVYFFHVDGTNTGDGTLADLAVNTPDGYEGFFDSQSGYSSETWITTPFAVNGQNAQTIGVQFSDQVVFNMPYEVDGANDSGTSDFSETLTLTGIELVNANGQPFSGWTVTSQSGTVYNQVYGSSVPGPAAALPFMTALVGLARKRMRR